MTRRSSETTTIQLWPSGRDVCFRGDPDGPANQKSLKISASCGGPLSAWRKGSAEEWRQVRIELRAKLYWERDGLGCDSMLVGDLVRLSYDSTSDIARAFDADELRNMYANPDDWDAVKCLEYLHEHTYEQNHYLARSKDWDGEVARFAAHEGVEPDEWNDKATEELRDACRELAQEHPAEVYEWWRVSQWLCDQLHAIGEVTIDNGYGQWWGRQASGQSVFMDGTLQQVAARFERLDG